MGLDQGPAVLDSNYFLDSANIMEWACDNLLSWNFEEKPGEADEKEKKRKDKAGRGSIISPTRSNLKSKAQVTVVSLNKLSK